MQIFIHCETCESKCRISLMGTLWLFTEIEIKHSPWGTFLIFNTFPTMQGLDKIGHLYCIRRTIAVPNFRDGRNQLFPRGCLSKIFYICFHEVLYGRNRWDGKADSYLIVTHTRSTFSGTVVPWLRAESLNSCTTLLLWPSEHNSWNFAFIKL
jgi:hypothetical protein